MMRQGKFDEAAVVLREAVLARPDRRSPIWIRCERFCKPGVSTKLSRCCARRTRLGSTIGGVRQLLLGTLTFRRKTTRKALEAFTTYLRDIPTRPMRSSEKKPSRSCDKLPASVESQF